MGVGYFIGEISSGLIHYIAVKPRFQGRGIGRNLREEVIEKFKLDGTVIQRPAQYCLGEVERDSDWMRYLLRQGVFFPDMDYFQPPVDTTMSPQRLEFYIQSLEGKREQINSEELINIVKAVYSNAYDIQGVESNSSFKHVVESIGDRKFIGPKRF